MSDQRVAIVTGASQGLGAGIAAAYRDLGYAVVGTSRTIGQSADPDFLTVAGDLAEPDTAQRVVDAALERFGRIDTLINNAGIFIAKPFTEYTTEDYERMLGVNVGGFYRLTQRVIDPILAQGGGLIVNITTTLVDSARSAVPAGLAAIAKGGISAATKSLAIEYAERGIRVNAVSPGMIDTPLQGGATDEQLGSFHPNKRAGKVSDIARAVIYLEQSPFVTGDVLHVDGGWSAGH